MAQIVPKLNLNKTPQLVDNNSLVFAKNIRLDANGIAADYGLDKLATAFPDGYKIVGIIPYNTKFYIFLYSDTDQQSENPSKIIEYDEEAIDGDNFKELHTAWRYSGGDIDGVCTVNLNGDTLLTIAESGDNIHVPLKTINLTEAHSSDDETIYTQTPNVPFINLIYLDKYSHPIPAGVYQFFIRYEIRKDFYTNWFPASKELFAGAKKSIRTHLGGFTYVDKSVDSDFSFVFNVEHVIKVSGFKSFQLGFILSHDEENYGRAYKHYSLDTEIIYFDYDVEAIEEIDVKELLESPYNLYNVGNLTSFKNKLYVSNYEETDFNPSIGEFANSVSIDIVEQPNNNIATLSGRDITLVTDNGVDYITAIKPATTDEWSGGETITVREIVNLSLNKLKDTVLVPHSKYWTQDTNFGINTKCYRTQRKLNLDPEYEGHDTIPTSLNKYALTIGNNSDSVLIESYNIDDIINYIVNTVYCINTNTGQSCDSSYHAIGYINTTYYFKENNDYYKVVLSIIFNASLSDIIKSYTLTNEYSLIPYQGYNFYLHLINANGEITNGYKINTEPVIISEPSGELPLHDFPAIYPKFTFSQNLPFPYIACFVSIAHVKNTVAHVFDIYQHKYGHCLELDLNLYPWLTDINFEPGGVKFDYRASYDTENLGTFGGAGECIFEEPLDGDITYGFAKMRYEANEKYIQLTKCTPFIVPSVSDGNYVYDEYKGLNLLGYLCRVKKTNRTIANNFYFVGSEIYKKTITSGQNENSSIELKPVEDNEVIWGLLSDSTAYTIYSNFNLNFLYLTNDFVPNIVTKTHENVKKSYTLLTVQNSSQLSEVYSFSGTYKTYLRKLYEVYTDDNVLTRFENTIRSSRLEGDEAKINTFRFNATDYYNVPTDKGIIVNLVAVGDNILVHTQDSIYKFSGQNSLTATGGEDVQMKESEPFDTGIQELFGSEFGYAGLASKRHQILSEFGYTFWDKDSGRIYMYTGNGQMKVLSDDISKLLKRSYISDICLADDYYNNRIFVCIRFGYGKVATLSYDFVAKSFISLHDFSFTWAFNTKTKCYFVHRQTSIYKIGTTIGGYLDLSIDDTLYPNHKRIVNSDNIYDCIVDIIFNSNYESIKTLNVLGWVCNEVRAFDNTINMAEESFTNNPIELRYKGDELTIYTDSCLTAAVDISGRTNDIALEDIHDQFRLKPFPDSYKQVRYNLGKWSFNYFRNILHRSDNQIGDRPFRQDDTLVYGKYIVARFVFHRNTNFKLEDVTFYVDNNYNV